MKFFTSILETLGYAAKWLGIGSLLRLILTVPYQNFSVQQIFILLCFSVVIFFVGVGFNRWELYIERKRTNIVKHYDTIILKFFACLLGVIGLFGILVEADLLHISLVVPSVYLYVSAGVRGDWRKIALAKKEEEAMKVEMHNTGDFQEITKIIDVEL